MLIPRLDLASTQPGPLARALALGGLLFVGWNLWPGVDADALLTPVPDFDQTWAVVLAAPFAAWIFVLWLPRLLWDFGPIVWAAAAVVLYLYLTFEPMFMPDYADHGNTRLARLFGNGFADFYFMLVIVTGFVFLPALFAYGIFLGVLHGFVAFREFVRSLFARPALTERELAAPAFTWRRTVALAIVLAILVFAGTAAWRVLMLLMSWA